MTAGTLSKKQKRTAQEQARTFVLDAWRDLGTIGCQLEQLLADPSNVQAKADKAADSLMLLVGKLRRGVET